MAAKRAAARKEGSAKAQAARSEFVKAAAAVTHDNEAAAKAEAAAEFGSGGTPAAAAAAAAYTGGRGGAGSGGSGRRQVMSSLFPHKAASKLPSASELGVSTNKSSTRSTTETVFEVDSMKDLYVPGTA